MLSWLYFHGVEEGVEGVEGLLSFVSRRGEVEFDFPIFKQVLQCRFVLAVRENVGGSCMFSFQESSGRGLLGPW